MRLILALALVLASCGDEDRPSPRPTTQWEAGPIIDGKNYSEGTRISGNTISIPARDGTHYITKATGSLADKTQITLTYRLDADIQGVKCGDGTISLYFQAKDDNWISDGKRWWTAPVNAEVGEHTITASLTGHWGSVLTMDSAQYPEVFAHAKANASRVGFTFGNCEGLGHGVYGPATFTVVSFSVE